MTKPCPTCGSLNQHHARHCRDRDADLAADVAAVLATLDRQVDRIAALITGARHD